MSYTSWSVIYGEQPSAAKWNILGTNDAEFDQRTSDGWTAAGETWVYASADDPTYTFTITGDKTAKYSAGMRIRLKQGGSYLYFIITKVAYSSPNTTVTVYGGTDYDLSNNTITDNYFSVVKAPESFPLDPSKWTETYSSASQATQGSNTANVWYNIGGSLSIPIGVWRVRYSVIGAYAKASTTDVNFYVSLSTANNSASDAEMTGFSAFSTGSSTSLTTQNTISREKTLVVTSKATYYLNFMSDFASGTLYCQGSLGKTIIKAICAYL